MIDVLTLDGDRIAAVTAFIVNEDPQAPGKPAEVFSSFGLPAELP